MVAGAAPPAAMIEGMERIGFDLTHVYGLTEVYGPAAVCAKHDEWAALDVDRARRAQRPPGRALPAAGRHDGDGPGDDAARCPADGETMGEIMFRGNITMKGYLKNPTATAEAFAGGWFHSGDLAVHAARRLREDQGPREGHHHLRRREHLVARGRGRAATGTPPCSRPPWWRSPTRSGARRRARSSSSSRTRRRREPRSSSTAARASRASRRRRRVVFGALPKTSTGKIQKFVLREQAKSATRDRVKETAA